MADEAPAIVVEHLTKRYGATVAVDDLSLRVGVGEVFALLGPNGAGKTTTIEILEGYRSRDGGRVEVLGLDPARDGQRLRRRIGLMLQEGGVYPQARPPEILHLFAQFYDRPEDPDDLLRLVGLDDARRTPYRRLSGGQKQRLSLALALIGRPELVFLDEPTAGMDPRARQATWEIIRGLRARAVTTVLTTHYMDEAEKLADQIGIVDRGRLIAIGDLPSLRRLGESGTTTVRLVVAGELDLATLTALPSASNVATPGAGVYDIATTEPSALVAEVAALAHRRGVLIHELRTGGASLEDIFLRLTERGDD